VVPQNDGKKIPLVVWNHSDHLLTGVTVHHRPNRRPSAPGPNWEDAFSKPYYIGTIAGSGHAPVPNAFMHLKFNGWKQSSSQKWSGSIAQNSDQDGG
jgi:hypothetical protein